MGYHEMIVHVPIPAVGAPRRVLIVGGGDGGSLRQVLRYPRWSRWWCANSKPAVVEAQPPVLPQIRRPLVGPRATLLVRDAFGYLEEESGPVRCHHLRYH